MTVSSAMRAATAAEVACHGEVAGGMQDLLATHDAILKKVFAWYASLPSLAGQASWEQFRHTQKGMLAGHLILLLTDFKVCPLLWVCHRFFPTESLTQFSTSVCLTYALAWGVAMMNKIVCM